MKERHNEKNATQAKVKVRKQFFIYSDGNGMLRIDEAGRPNFKSGELVVYATKGKATFARSFFMSMKIADSLDILTKVA